MDTSQQALIEIPYQPSDQELEALERDLMDIHQISASMAQLVSTQGEQIGLIEDHIADTVLETEQANIELATALDYKKMRLPIIGAAIGGLVLGPVGAILGVKGAVLYGVTGLGIFSGYKGGNALKNV